MRHELFELLDSINPHWQVTFDSLRHASEAYDLLPEFYDFMHTDAGIARTKRLDGIPDTIAQNRAERNMRDKALRMPSRANPLVDDEMDAEDYG